MTKKKAAKKATTSRRGVRTPGSMADQIDRMEIGETISVAERFEIEGVDAGGLLETLKRLRGGLAAYVGRVTDDVDMRKFKIEGGEYVTDDKSAIVVTAAVTRLD